MEGEGPVLVFDRESCAVKHGAYGGVHGLIGAFDEAVFVVGFGGNGDEREVEFLFEELADEWVLVEFTTLVHVDVAVVFGRVDGDVFSKPKS